MTPDLFTSSAIPPAVPAKPNFKLSNQIYPHFRGI
jgi:hypothetical protein